MKKEEWVGIAVLMYIITLYIVLAIIFKSYFPNELGIKYHRDYYNFTRAERLATRVYLT